MLKDGQKTKIKEIKINGGFVYKNVHFKKGSSGFVYAIGEMTNNSGKDYSYAHFTMSIYDKDNNLLDIGNILICNLKNKQTKSFKTLFSVNYSLIRKYKINFEY